MNTAKSPTVETPMLHNWILALSAAMFLYFFFNQPTSAAAPIMQVRNPIAIIGETEDKRYPVYDLEGAVDDVNYRSRNGTVYQPDDLPSRLRFLRPEDAKSGKYVCSFTCQDNRGRIVGMNPTWAKVYGFKLANK
jgi:hypothetical protein